MDYLYALQLLREGAGSGINPFFVVISELVIASGPIILVFVYWCVDKRIGAWGLFNVTLANTATHVLKLTTCVYRPWVIDERLHIAPEAANTASGYSFPSGHTTTAATAYGSIAVWQRRRFWVVAIMVVLIVLTGFARNWLGAHTLQDVLAAAVVAGVVMLATTLAMRHMDKHPNRDVVAAAVVLALCALAAIFVTIKPYPMEYLPTGELLVDPNQMTPSFWSSLGLTAGWTISWLVERRFVQFDCGGTRGRKALRFIAGAALIGVVYLVVMPMLVAGLSPIPAKFLRRFVTVIVAGCVYPAIIKQVQTRFA